MNRDDLISELLAAAEEHLLDSEADDLIDRFHLIEKVEDEELDRLKLMSDNELIEEYSQHFHEIPELDEVEA